MAARRGRREPQSAFDAIIPDLYDALLEPRTWPQVLSRVADAAGVGGVHFLFWGSAGQALMSEMSVGISPGTNDLYRDYYGGIDPRRQLIHRVPVGHMMLCQDSFDADFVRRNEFYNDYCIAVGFRYMAGARVFREDGHDAMFGFLKNVGSDPFDAREVRAIRMLMPHLRRVAQLQYRLTRAEAHASPLSGALDRLDSAVLVVDGALHVRHANLAADALLRTGDGMRLRDGRLTAMETNAAKRLELLVAEAAACAAGGDPHKGGGSLAVPRTNGRPLLLLVTPLPPASAAHFWRAEPAVAVFVTDPEAKPQVPEDRLAELFGLTPAEARLAARLAAGDSLAEAADAFGLSKHTIRVQLRALMDKTDTHRQAALVRLLVSSTQLLSR